MGNLEYEALAREAAAKGFGKLYAVFGGGLDGLRACAAGAMFLSPGRVHALFVIRRLNAVETAESLMLSM